MDIWLTGPPPPSMSTWFIDDPLRNNSRLPFRFRREFSDWRVVNFTLDFDRISTLENACSSVLPTNIELQKTSFSFLKLILNGGNVLF